MTLSVRSLASGSSGNAILITAGTTRVLIDCGVGSRSLTSLLGAEGIRLADLTAVLLTHEHADHARATPAILAARVPVVATAGTARMLGIAAESWQPIAGGQQVRLPELTVHAVSVAHDAAEPCGFLVEGHTGSRLLVVTDLGHAGPELHEPLAACDLIVLEANHDLALLRDGPYPAQLKRRVLSPTGHLSNADCGALLAAALGRGRRSMPPTIWLAHLSRINNRPELARRTVAETLLAAGIAAPVLPLPRQTAGPRWRASGGPAAAMQLPLLGLSEPDGSRGRP